MTGLLLGLLLAVSPAEPKTLDFSDTGFAPYGQPLTFSTLQTDSCMHVGTAFGSSEYYYTFQNVADTLFVPEYGLVLPVRGKEVRIKIRVCQQ